MTLKEFIKPCMTGTNLSLLRFSKGSIQACFAGTKEEFKMNAIYDDLIDLSVRTYHVAHLSSAIVVVLEEKS